MSNGSLFKLNLNTFHLFSFFFFQFNPEVTLLVQNHLSQPLTEVQAFLFILSPTSSIECSHLLSLHETKQHFSSVYHYDRIQLLVLFIGGRKLMSFGKVSLRLRSAGLRRLGRFACCRIILNTSTTLTFSFADASR